MNTLNDMIIIASGIFSLAFAIFHLMFWRLFHWKKALAALKPVNRSIMQVMNLCLIFLFLMMAYISFFHGDELTHTNLGKAILSLFSFFWLLRMLEQIMFFGVKTGLSIILTLLFLLGSILYIIPVFYRAI
jgi:hypothetical protein